ncbi:DUF4381 domain-containing protein [Halosquirtibacter xylanolyticus]|uniref:DUF4381 domain-containing protein n=1 Tax=Halosquirtibacter xylanolyticus TaxID=3374599 RepID=UPI003748D77D|nr:DUF4381 domain-containing protein [Prolixibacteraceae bacterium]
MIDITPQTYFYKLKDMHPIARPKDVIFWPETIGWKIVTLLLLLTISYIIYKLITRYNRRKYRKHAIKTITDAFRLQTKGDLSQEEYIKICLSQFKIVGIESYGRKEVASLKGERWAIYINDRAGKECIAPNLLCKAEKTLYSLTEKQMMDTKELNKLNRQIIKWIGGHHV